MQRVRFLPALVLGAGLVFVLGCGDGPKYVPVSGTVKLNGKPYPNAAVFFQPVGGKDNQNPGRGSAGITDENGKFVLKTTEGVNGAVIGSHQIKIQTHEANLAPFDAATGTADSVPGGGKEKYDPIPIDWRTMGKHTFDVPAGGTDKADFDIVNPRAK